MNVTGRVSCAFGQPGRPFMRSKRKWTGIYLVGSLQLLPKLPNVPRKHALLQRLMDGFVKSVRFGEKSLGKCYDREWTKPVLNQLRQAAVVEVGFAGLYVDDHTLATIQREPGYAAGDSMVDRADAVSLAAGVERLELVHCKPFQQVETDNLRGLKLLVLPALVDVGRSLAPDIVRTVNGLCNELATIAEKRGFRIEFKQRALLRVDRL